MIPMLNTLTRELDQIIAEMLKLQIAYQAELELIHPANRVCARNLIDYLSFRSADRTLLQHRLSQIGLSSLGRSEAAIRPQLHRVRALVDRLNGSTAEFTHDQFDDPVEKGRLSLVANTNTLFGPCPSDRHTRIMVTMPAEASNDCELIRKLLHSGMNVARINCAHDNPRIWQKIASNLRQCSEELQLPCRIMMDLAGPKLRTGPMPEGVHILKAKPPKNSRGQIIRSGRVTFYTGNTPPNDINQTMIIPLAHEDSLDLNKVTWIELRDTRDKKRRLNVVESSADTVLAKIPANTFFETGQSITLHTQDGQISSEIGLIPETESFLNIQVGDHLKLVSNNEKARHPVLDENGKVIKPATVSCGVPEALAAPEIGHRIKLDDGKFTGVVVDKGEGWLLLEITAAPIHGGKLKAEKGINFPDTELPISGLTNKDIDDLAEICQPADLIALSFVNTREDVESLCSELKKRNSEHIGIILKIETKRAYENLPSLLLSAMKIQQVGVMVARGDLAVEIGWRQMAEIQEEILWLCAAAHIPSIWATQVLETMAKSGQPTRSEITDAAMAQRAECVMLNKGPYIHEAVQMLHRIIRTMDIHQYKKSARFPKISCKLAPAPARKGQPA